MLRFKILIILLGIVLIIPNIVLLSIMRKITKELDKVFDEYESDLYSEYEKYLMTGIEDGWLQPDKETQKKYLQTKLKGK